MIQKLLSFHIQLLANHLLAEPNILKDAVEILKEKNVNFEFDGDMQPDVALNKEYKVFIHFQK